MNCGKMDSHADDECFDLKSNAHFRLNYWKTGKRKWHEGGGNKYNGGGKATRKIANVIGSYNYLEASKDNWSPLQIQV